MKKKLMLALICLMAVGVILLIVWQTTGKSLSGKADFLSFYIAATRIRTGHATDIYNLAAYPKMSPYVRASWEAFIFVPFTLFSYRVAFALWTVVSVLLLGICVYLLRSGIRFILVAKSQLWRRLALFGMLLPIGVALTSGQDTALFLLLIILTVISARNGRDVDAGICLGLASIKLQLLLPIFALIMLRGRWRIMSSIALTGIFLFTLSIAVAGPNWMAECFHAQASVSNQFGFDTARYVMGVVGLNKYVPLAILAGIGTSLWVVRKMPLDRSIAWMMVAAVFFNWHAMFYDYAVSLPAILPDAETVDNHAERGNHGFHAAPSCQTRLGIADTT